MIRNNNLAATDEEDFFENVTDIINF